GGNTGSFCKSEGEVLAAVESYFLCNIDLPHGGVREEKFSPVDPQTIHVCHDAASKLPVKQCLQVAAVDSGLPRGVFHSDCLCTGLFQISSGTAYIDQAAARLFLCRGLCKLTDRALQQVSDQKTCVRCVSAFQLSDEIFHHRAEAFSSVCRKVWFCRPE